MDAERFWTLLEGAVTARDHDEPFGSLTAALKCLTPEEILAFKLRFEGLIGAAYRNDLWGAAYLINGGSSDDNFHYFRVWLVSTGRAVYQKALANPDSLADVLDEAVKRGDEFCESGLDGAPARVWTELTGRSDEEFYGELARMGNWTPDVDEGEDWDFEDNAEMRRRLPRLSGIFLPSEG